MLARIDKDRPIGPNKNSLMCLQKNIKFNTFIFSQVKFHVLSTVFRVATKAGHNWVTMYRLAYSEDCVNFNNVLDNAGNNIVINLFISLTDLK